MKTKPYSFGLMVGRFQTLHSGHEMMLRKAVELCERTGVFIGSSQESGTEKNPFSYETRAAMLRAVMGDSIELYPLPDIGVGNNSKWGEYVLDKVYEQAGCLPDLLVSGKEPRRIDWFDCERGFGISELYIPKTIDISATRMRQFLVDDDFESWKGYVNPALWEMYEALRTEVLASLNNKTTMSI